MTDFLLELRSEEIPARMQAKARDDLEVLFINAMEAVGIDARTQSFSTPRRLTLIAQGLPLETAAVSEEIKGPKSSAPPQALEGFLRKTGLTRDQLVERDGVLFAVIDKPGRATADVLAEAIPRIIRAFPWPKSMRWGDASLSTESLKWVRPLQGIVALLGTDIVPCEIAGITSGRETMGHRFHSTGLISIESAATYADQLRDAHVIVDQDERANIIAVGAKLAARKTGLTLIEDAGLLAENAGLTEWPVPLLGRFDAAFLSVPPEVIQLTARVNQKYFVCSDADGKLANAFICTANIDAADGGAKIIDGNRKVLAARLSDAKFFYDTDLKVALEEQAKKLDRIVFHEKLGTVADKVARVAKLARWLVEQGIVGGSSHTLAANSPFVSSEVEKHATSAAQGVSTSLDTNGSGVSLADLAERAALLCKADLVTGMVGEFPELQGLMGGYYAAAQGLDPRVAAAIRDHYKPVGQGDDVPTDPVTVAVSLADKLDTIIVFFGAAEKPTGSKDPFALRRAVLAIVHTTIKNGIRLPLAIVVRKHLLEFVVSSMSGLDSVRQGFRRVGQLIEASNLGFTGTHDGEIRIIIPNGNNQIEVPIPSEDAIQVKNLVRLVSRVDEVQADILDFFADRLKVQQREAGVRHDLIDAVFALGGEDDLVRLLARVHALQAFIGTPDGANLLAGYKRAANILKKEAPASTPAKAGVQEPQAPSPAALDPRLRGGTEVGEEGISPPSAPAKAGVQEPQAPSPVTLDRRLRGGTDGHGASGLSYTPEPAEAALIAALDAAEPAAAAAVAQEDFEAAMSALATLRAPIDAFFETVIVNDPDPAKRTARLAMLEKVRNAVHGVADFSKIEG